ncbi:MAG: hypothetical protein ABIJ53_08080 [Verrucomicrobiota bacterium]
MAGVISTMPGGGFGQLHNLGRLRVIAGHIGQAGRKPGAPDYSGRYSQWKNWLLPAMGHKAAAIRAMAGWEWLNLPLYYGSCAAEKMILPEAFVRLPDLGPRGIETVKQTLADQGRWERCLDAIAEARCRILSSLRLVEWMANKICRQP